MSQKLVYPIEQPTVSLNRTWAYWQSAFDYEEIKTLVDYCENKLSKIDPLIAGPDGKAVKMESYRKGKLSWIPVNNDTKWIYDKLANHTAIINEKCFRYDLTGFATELQYLEYDGSENDHIDWHADNPSAATNNLPRKLNCITQLSEPMSYEGGELWIWGKSKEVLPKDMGTTFYFPSMTQHRVTPVTKGIRRSLLAWITGPEFR